MWSDVGIDGCGAEGWGQVWRRASVYGVTRRGDGALFRAFTD